ncbi:MAG TPA: gamma-glutamyltransferase [Rhodanobacteraceae bacterium]|nr:gamma-glutamyltransferase [Rhodanobacteraceae bacterium]
MSMVRTSKPLLGMILLLLASVAGAATARPQAPTRGPGHAAIASAHKLATLAGFEVLDEGGNAFDAAVAVASTLAVVEPQSSGIGGGFFAILHFAASNSETMLDAREVAPAAVSSSLYVGKEGKPNRDTALNGPLAAGIPGEPAGLVWMASHYGKLPLAKSLAPAIRIASEGFKPSTRFLAAVDQRQKVLARYPGSRALLLPGGKPPAAGEIFRNPDMAKTLKLIADKGDAGFYQGALAHAMVDAVRAAGGNWSLADLANYRARERTPITIDYKGARIVTVAPPSSGGVAMAEIFNILRHIDLNAMDSAHRVHYIIEAMRRAFRDHNAYLGDPDFVKMPLKMLLSPFYADGLRASILPDKATPSSMLPPASNADVGMHTTHFSIIDADGNMVAATLTVNTHFGSAFVAPGTGFVLNNEMDDFALVPGAPNAYGLRGNKANAPEGGKRMLSSMSPTIVFAPHRIGVLGSPGGSTIITQVFEGILGFINGKSAQDIVAKPRFHHQYLPDLVYTEPGVFSTKTDRALEAMGYTLKSRKPWGFMNMVIWNLGDNTLEAASDPRGGGVGLGKVE